MYILHTGLYNIHLLYTLMLHTGLCIIYLVGITYTSLYIIVTPPLHTGMYSIQYTPVFSPACTVHTYLIQRAPAPAVVCKQPPGLHLHCSATQLQCSAAPVQCSSIAV